MNNPTVIDLINELEDKIPVDAWTADALHLWPLMRFHLYFSFFNSSFCGKTVLPPPLGNFSARPLAGALDRGKIGIKMLQSLGKFVYANIRDARNSQHRDRKNFDALFLNYNTYMTLVNGSWYSRLCDPFIDHFSSRGFSSLMLSAGYEYAIPRSSKSVFIQPRLTACRVAGKLKANTKNLKLDKIGEAEALIKKSGLLARNFNLLNPVLDSLKQIKEIEKYFLRILKENKPRLAFVTSYYSTESLALILACREMDVPSVDIQHGFQGQFHAAYGRWNRLPGEGYELLPDFFWCWGEQEAEAINKWSGNKGRHQPLAGGNLFLERWRSESDSLTQAYDARISKVKSGLNKNIHILYTLNGCSGNELQILAGLIKETAQLNCCFWIRMHPVTVDQKPKVKKFLAEKGISGFVLEEATDFPLYAVLRQMDLHITECSSVVIEAEAFGVPSILLRNDNLEHFASQLESGWALSSSLGQAAAAVKLQLERKTSLRAKKSAGPGSRLRFLEYLTGIIANKGN